MNNKIRVPHQIQDAVAVLWLKSKKFESATFLLTLLVGLSVTLSIVAFVRTLH